MSFIQSVNIIRSTVAGVNTIAEGFFEVSLSNVGGAEAIVKGVTLGAGETITFRARSGSGIESITYDSLGSVLLITTIL